MMHDSKRLDQAKSAKGKKLLKERFNLIYDEKKKRVCESFSVNKDILGLL